MDFKEFVTQNKGYNDDDTINDIAELMTIAWNAALEEVKRKKVLVRHTVTHGDNAYHNAVLVTDIDNLKK